MKHDRHERPRPPAMRTVKDRYDTLNTLNLRVVRMLNRTETLRVGAELMRELCYTSELLSDFMAAAAVARERMAEQADFALPDFALKVLTRRVVELEATMHRIAERTDGT